MRVFRAYLLNAAGKIVWGEWIEAADLAEAQVKAHELCREGTPTVELWEGSRPMAEVPCDPKMPVRALTDADR